MATAADLNEAAYLSFAQCSIKWRANTLHTSLNTFVNEAKDILPQGVEAGTTGSVPGNWFISLCALSTLVNSETPYNGLPLGLELFYQIVFTLYRLCYVASAATAGQQADLLAAWNTAFGT